MRGKIWWLLCFTTLVWAQSPCFQPNLPNLTPAPEEANAPFDVTITIAGGASAKLTVTTTGDNQIRGFLFYATEGTPQRVGYWDYTATPNVQSVPGCDTDARQSSTITSDPAVAFGNEVSLYFLVNAAMTGDVTFTGVVALENGVSYDVSVDFFIPTDTCGDADGFPASPLTLPPFVQPFATPPQAQVAALECDEIGRCIAYYEMTVQAVNAQVLPGRPTELYTYNGTAPGPTIRLCRGVQSMVRFINNLRINNNTEDRAIAIHLHGSPSAAAWDGWADDEITTGNFKDYFYPNPDVADLWYHDHAHAITMENAYHGLAGQYLVFDCCDPIQNLLPAQQYQLEFVLGDRVFDQQNQLFADPAGVHNNLLYGDHIAVNGVIWPLLHVEPRKYFFHSVDAAPSRQFLLTLDNGQPLIVVSTEGGFLRTPQPVKDILISPGERYGFIIDFSQVPFGSNITMQNENTPEDPPTFCQTNLVMRFVVDIPLNLNIPDPALPAQLREGRALENLIPADILARAADPDVPADREVEFVRSGSGWKVRVDGGEALGWDDTAPDHVVLTPAVNGVEIWAIDNGGGGWVHPIHLHLIEFVITWRDDGPLAPYETDAIKDTIFLNPSEETRVVARFGPNLGQFMFHCHNLVHEDSDMMLAMNVTVNGDGRSQDIITTIPTSPKPALADLGNPLARPQVTQALLESVGFQVIDPLGNVTPFLLEWLKLGVYDVFYPTVPEGLAVNPYEVDFTTWQTCNNGILPLPPNPVLSLPTTLPTAVPTTSEVQAAEAAPVEALPTEEAPTEAVPAETVDPTTAGVEAQATEETPTEVTEVPANEETTVPTTSEVQAAEDAPAEEVPTEDVPTTNEETTDPTTEVRTPEEVPTADVPTTETF